MSTVLSTLSKHNIPIYSYHDLGNGNHIITSADVSHNVRDILYTREDLDYISIATSPRTTTITYRMKL